MGSKYEKVLYMPNNVFSNSAFTEYTHPFDLFSFTNLMHFSEQSTLITSCDINFDQGWFSTEMQ